MLNKLNLNKLLMQLTLLFACGLVTPSMGWALSCKSPSLSEVYNRYDTVIAGLIISAVDGNLNEGKVKTRLFTLQVLNTWKGDVSDTMRLFAKYDDYEPPLKVNRNYVLFLGKPDEEGRYPIHYCQPQENIGEENGYLVTLLLDKIAKEHPRYFLGYKERTPENTNVGYGLGLTEEESLRRAHEQRAKP